MKPSNNPHTPGVYITEQNASLNTVDQVPTAIPAFIGYTEWMFKDEELISESEPLLINSMSDYFTHFGGEFTSQFPIEHVEVGSDKKPASHFDFEVNGKYYKIGKPAAGKCFYLYDSLQLFYQNGGGPCYIMSIGTHVNLVAATPPEQGYVNVANKPKKEDFLKGLAKLRKVSSLKPTIIVMPEALLLPADDYYTVQQQALLQCEELSDRIAMIDVYDGNKDLDSGVINDFRNKIGNNAMQYGVCYYPFLETTIVDASHMSYANVDQSATALDQIFVGEKALASLEGITKDVESVKGLYITPAMNFGQALPDTLPFGAGGDSDVFYPSWSKAVLGHPSDADHIQILQWQLRVLLTMAWVLYDVKEKGQEAIPKVSVGDANLKKRIEKRFDPASKICQLFEQLYSYDYHFKPNGSETTLLGVITKDSVKNRIGITLKDAPFFPPYGYYKTDKMYDTLKPVLIKALNSLLNEISRISRAAYGLLMDYSDALSNSNPDYKTMMTALAKHAGILPPSGAIAGVYNLVDSTEGVWVAPANRNINSVTAPTVAIDNDQQADLNVDAVTGKSINAIRSFHGRGPAIIWGARTLDGNSMDWKYINVRRTMIMMEQSIANAVQPFVFQANDASTWNQVEATISNFLNSLWSQGALQGAAASDAYSVAVGLGKTMTPQDILNGIMRVETKVALVHPAEYIIITYEQEMATS